MFFRYILTCIALTGFLSTAYAGYEEGFSAAQRGNYKIALQEWQPLAEEGDISAQYNLGVMYANGYGVPQSYQHAAKWYRLAAEHGFAPAQYSLGVLYSKGQGVPQSFHEASKWYRLAAEQGEAKGQYNLGMAYYYNQGEQQDYKEAIKWLRLAAEQGHAKAQNNLGLMYSIGQGVPKNLVVAYALCNFAAANQRLINALESRELIITKMTASEIEAGQELTRQMANHPVKALDAYLSKVQR